MNDQNPYSIAHKLIEYRGDDTAAIVKKIIDESISMGDLNSVEQWRAIYAAICDIQKSKKMAH